MALGWLVVCAGQFDPGWHPAFGETTAAGLRPGIQHGRVAKTWLTHLTRLRGYPHTPIRGSGALPFTKDGSKKRVSGILGAQKGH
jgi:hypothetical protein